MNPVERIFRDHLGDKCWPKGDELYFKCINPDHKDRNPSMSVNLQTLVYHCLGCGMGGHADALLARLAGIKVTEAKRMLKGAGVGRTTRSDSVMNDKKFSGRFVPLQTDYLMQYLKRRGIDQAAVDTLDLREGAITDSIWRHRIVWPYRNRNQRLVQIEGRNTDSNGSRPPYWKEGKSVSGLTGAELLGEMNGCRKPVIVVEGCIDMLSIRSVGYMRVVGQGGSAFGKERALALKSWTDYPIVLYDAPKKDTKKERARVVKTTSAILSAYHKRYAVLELPGEDEDPNSLLLAGTLARELRGLGLKRKDFI